MLSQQAFLMCSEYLVSSFRPPECCTPACVATVTWFPQACDIPSLFLRSMVDKFTLIVYSNVLTFIVKS